MTKTKVVEKVQLEETRRVTLGETELTKFSVVLQPDGYIFLNERFKDLNKHTEAGVFDVGMLIRKEYVSNLLRVLLDAGFEPS
jgi:hypothetical protein